MNYIIGAITILLFWGVFSLFSSRHRALGPIISSVLALIPAMKVLISGDAESIRIPISFFYGSLYFQLDSLSAFFIIPIAILATLTSLYGVAHSQKTKTTTLFFNILVMSMFMVVCAKNVILFLLSWELMSLSSFFLVMTNGEKQQTKKSGWLYLCLTHVGTMCLIAFFFILTTSAASLDLDNLSLAPQLANICFVLALIGFGSKAGIIPLHIWLPEAHPAAPSHISALMSGVMIKMGIYGLIRTIVLIGAPPSWWGITLLIVGAISGIGGVLFALAQHDIKRLLAYHSVENIGIILMGMGLGLWGISQQIPFLSVLGFAGALLHVLNHALFKGLLFLGAGSVISATHIHHIDELGGLLKKMPITAITFLIGAISICGIPPFNGFISEFLIYLASFKGIANGNITDSLLPLIAILSLILIGGLAALCFTKAFGIIFLGESRSIFDCDPQESSWLMTLPMVVLSILCLFIGLFPQFVLQLLKKPLEGLISTSQVSNILQETQPTLENISNALLIFTAIVLCIAFIRKLIIKRKKVTLDIPTWDCGYIHPRPTMQYTASSFVDGLLNLFSFVLKTKKDLIIPNGYFPGKSASLKTMTEDTWTKYLYRPIKNFTKKVMIYVTRIQYGSIHLYILYIVLTLTILLTLNYFAGGIQ